MLGPKAEAPRAFRASGRCERLARSPVPGLPRHCPAASPTCAAPPQGATYWLVNRQMRQMTGMGGRGMGGRGGRGGMGGAGGFFNMVRPGACAD